MTISNSKWQQVRLAPPVLKQWFSNFMPVKLVELLESGAYPPGALSQAIWGIILNKLPGDCKCRWSSGQPDSANTIADLSALSCRCRGSPTLASTLSSLSPDIASAFTSESLSGVPTTFFLSWNLSSEMVLGGQISLNQSEVSFLFWQPMEKSQVLWMSLVLRQSGMPSTAPITAPSPLLVRGNCFLRITEAVWEAAASWFSE